MATWPGSVFTFPTFTDFFDTVQASHQNIPQEELTAVMSSLGANFTGSFSNLTSLWQANHLENGNHGTLVASTADMFGLAVTNVASINILDVNSSFRVNGTMAITSISSLSSLHVASGPSGISHPALIKTLVIGAADFQKADPAAGLNPAIVAEQKIRPNSTNNTNALAYAVMHLPIGATISLITIYGGTVSISDRVEVSLRRYTNPQTVLGLGSAIITSGQSTSVVGSSAGSKVTVSSSYYVLLASLKTSTQINSVNLYQVQVTYGVDDMSRTI